MARSKNEIKAMITKDISNIHYYGLEVKKFINDQFEDTMDYLHSLIAEIAQTASGPSTTKTSKVLKKKDFHRMETIPENDIINIDNTVSGSTAIHDKTENKDIKIGDVVETIGRTRREASRKAEINIKKQLSMSLVAKLRRPSILDDDSNVNRKRGSRSRKKESARSSSDEKNTQGPTKHSKTEKNVLSKTISRRVAGTSKIHSQDHLFIKEDPIQPEKIEPLKSSMTTRNSNIKRNFSQSENTEGKYSNIIDDTVIAPTGNDIEELSMCEDALEIFTPLMNSTMNTNSTSTQKMMNATVILEPLSPIKLNETVVINKNLASSTGKNVESKFTQNRSMTSSEDAILNTPTKPSSKEKNTITGFQEIRNRYKSNALFDPYIKVSVKKRIEAFEQAGVNTPKLVVDIDAPTRITRTKTREQNTRAAAQTEASENANIAEKTIARKLARKSVAKAKKILLAKENKDVDERRKQEEQQRLQRLQKQDEAQRASTEQRRREQKAERRKEAELGVQRQAADEVMKTKHQMITSQPQYGSKQQDPTTYILTFWMVNLTTMNQVMNLDQSIQFHIVELINIRMHRVLECLSILAHIRENQLAMQRYIPEKAVYKFFDSRKCTPNLTEMFQNIDRSRLQRTSSAIWKTPPRYSMMKNE